jgi:molybdopterin molybdotransferase
MLSECAWDLAYQVASDAFLALEVEVLPLVLAHGRVLNQPTFSLCDLPAFATSSMDGWVVRGPGPWKIVGEISTGSLTDQVLGESECMKIATGGVIPIGGESVLPWEQVKEEDGYVQGQSEVGVNIRPVGMESKKGDLLFDAGATLNPPKIGVLAATGHDEIIVARKPRIALFILGDELLHSGVPKAGSIRDSLGPQLPAFLEIYGAHVVSVQFIKDDLDLLISSIDSALPNVDMVITTGGTADGPRDYIKSAIARLGGDYLIDRVKVRPGYHVLLAKIPSQLGRQKPFLALPGNPQSALAALTSFGQPIINALLGKKKVLPSTIKLSEILQTPHGFSRLVPGHLDEDRFMPSGYLGSAMLRGVAHATGFALVSPGRHDVGASARWLPLPT